MSVAVYLLLDSSASMAGPRLQSMMDGVETLLTALSTVRIDAEIIVSAFTYASQITPLWRSLPVKLCQIETPRVGGTSGLGKALLSCAASIAQDKLPSLVLAFTDGVITDDWRTAGAQLRLCNIPLQVIGMACGNDSNLLLINEILDHVIRHAEYSPEQLSDLITDICKRLITKDGEHE